jgi:hypothetical protein
MAPHGFSRLTKACSPPERGTVGPGSIEGDEGSAGFARLTKHLPTIKQPGGDSRKMLIGHPEPRWN